MSDTLGGSCDAKGLESGTNCTRLQAMQSVWSRGQRVSHCTRRREAPGVSGNLHYTLGGSCDAKRVEYQTICLILYTLRVADVWNRRQVAFECTRFRQNVRTYPRRQRPRKKKPLPLRQKHSEPPTRTARRRPSAHPDISARYWNSSRLNLIVYSLTKARDKNPRALRHALKLGGNPHELHRHPPNIS